MTFHELADQSHHLLITRYLLTHYLLTGHYLLVIT